MAPSIHLSATELRVLRELGTRAEALRRELDGVETSLRVAFQLIADRHDQPTDGRVQFDPVTGTLTFESAPSDAAPILNSSLSPASS